MGYCSLAAEFPFGYIVNWVLDCVKEEEKHVLTLYIFNKTMSRREELLFRKPQDKHLTKKLS